MSDGKRLKQKGFHLSTERWLLQNEYNSFASFNGAQWLKGVKIIVYKHDKALTYLKGCARGSALSYRKCKNPFPIAEKQMTF